MAEIIAAGLGEAAFAVGQLALAPWTDLDRTAEGVEFAVTGTAYRAKIMGLVEGGVFGEIGQVSGGTIEMVTVLPAEVLKKFRVVQAILEGTDQSCGLPGCQVKIVT